MDGESSNNGAICQSRFKAESKDFGLYYRKARLMTIRVKRGMAMVPPKSGH